MLMNPPLGDLDHLAVGEDLARAGLIPVDAQGPVPTAREATTAAQLWAKSHLHAVETTCVEEERQIVLEEKCSAWKAKVDAARATETPEKNRTPSKICERWKMI